MEHPISGYKWTMQADSHQVVSATFSIDGKPVTVSMSPNYVEIVDGALVSTMFFVSVVLGGGRISMWDPRMRR